jgi:hypothetical protein
MPDSFMDTSYADEIELIPEEARKAASALKGAFYWEKTKEGNDYWAAVVNELDRLALTAPSRPQ